MRYLLDTDHLSVLQRQLGKDYSNLSARIAQNPISDFAVSTVTFHEQVLGSHAYINRARNLNDVVKGYEMMARIISDFKVLPLISFDTGAAKAAIQNKLNTLAWFPCPNKGLKPLVCSCYSALLPKIFDQLQVQRIQLAKMDARIAAIALCRGLILLTRNHQDFGKVSGY